MLSLIVEYFMFAQFNTRLIANMHSDGKTDILAQIDYKSWYLLKIRLGATQASTSASAVDTAMINVS